MLLTSSLSFLILLLVFRFSVLPLRLPVNWNPDGTWDSLALSLFAQNGRCRTKPVEWIAATPPSPSMPLVPNLTVVSLSPFRAMEGNSTVYHQNPMSDVPDHGDAALLLCERTSYQSMTIAPTNPLVVPRTVPSFWSSVHHPLP